MIVQQGLAALRATPAGSTMSIGNFDGVHVGHRAICDAARHAANVAGGELVVVTFEPHPLTVLRPTLVPPRLTSVAARRDALAALGVDRLIELPPGDDVLGLAADAFYAILRDAARVARLVEGADFTFGKGRGGDVATLAGWCARDNVALDVVGGVAVTLDDRSTAAVSSTLIRWLLANGRAGDAMRCLGRPYRLEGVVVGGEQRGRTIGFPTANLQVAPDALVPADGVYAATCAIDGATRGVALSIGTKPTFHQQTATTIEGFVLDYAGDFYGRTLAFDVVAWLRGQQKYPSVDALVADLNRDVARVRELVA